MCHIPLNQKKQTAMKNFLLLVQGLVTAAFGLWLINRNQVWSNADLLPSEMLTIYYRDSSDFFLLLRMVYMLFLGYGFYVFFRWRRYAYVLVPLFAFAGLLVADSAAVAYAMDRLMPQYGEWMLTAIPGRYYKGLVEAVVLVPLVTAAVIFVARSRGGDIATLEVEH